MFGHEKFSSRCKHAIKNIKSRIEIGRRKSQAIAKYLKNDVAELLANAHATNAFGRMASLMTEMNHVSCYDMLENYCECILKQLPILQKKRECPEEAREAVSTLIYATARFSDLPELCDLRTLFTERYRSHMESSINKEFVSKVQKKSFSSEKKLQLMHSIAKEFSVSWDSTELIPTLSDQFRTTPASPEPREKLSENMEPTTTKPKIKTSNSADDVSKPKPVSVRKNRSMIPLSVKKDKEEEEMDRLLVHYSTKETPSQEELLADAEGVVSKRYERVASLPSVTRAGKGHGRSASVNVRDGNVHPMLPDCDELAERFAAIRRK